MGSLEPRKNDSSTTVNVRSSDLGKDLFDELSGLGLTPTPVDVRMPIALVSTSLPPFPTFTTPVKAPRSINLRPRFRSQNQSELHCFYIAMEVDLPRSNVMTDEEQVSPPDSLCYTPSLR